MDLKRKRLSLKDKVQVVEIFEKEKLSVRNLAERFKVGKTQISEILKNKDEVRKLWFTNSNENSKVMKIRKPENSALDSAVFEWFCSSRARNITVSGSALQEKAKEIAESLKMENFKASNGWLEKFRTRHGLSSKTANAEPKSADQQQVEDWVEKLVVVCENYEAKNIFNCDETALFFKILPSRPISFPEEHCVDGKVSKQRLTVLLCCNLQGKFEEPLVVGKAKSFKNSKPKHLPVQWVTNQSAQMTQKIMTDWLIALDERMKCENRNILLFMGNAAAHPADIDFSTIIPLLKNIGIVFFPPNITSKFEPLVQGIIRSFKVEYKKLFLSHVIAQKSTTSCSEKAAESVTMLDVINWIAKAVGKISLTHVTNCFSKAGFQKTQTIEENYCIQQPESIPEDKEICELESLVEELDSEVVLENYLSLDESSFSEVTDNVLQYIPVVEVEDCGDNDNSSVDEVEHCEITNYKNVLHHAEEMKRFFEKAWDNEALDLLSKLKFHVEKQVYVNRLQYTKHITPDFCS